MDNKEQEQIEFVMDDGNKVSFFVLEQTKVMGVNYILVTDSEEDEAEAFIMKEADGQDIYEMVTDDNELLAVSKLFEELLDDIDIHI